MTAAAAALKKSDAKRPAKIRAGFGSNLFDAVNYFLLALVSLVMILPFIHVLAASLTPIEDLLKRDFILFPTRLSLDAYRYVFSTPIVARGLLISIFITVSGTTLNLLLSSLTAYPLAHRNLLGGKVMSLLVVFTLIFNGGMIPMFIMVQKLRLLNTYWALILPYVISSFNLMLFRNYFREMPDELEEAAKIEGYNDLSILFRIILPLAKPLLATFAIIFGVDHWNSWFNATLYLSNSRMWPIQVILRQVITSMSQVGDAMGGTNYIPPMTVRMCTIVVATVPILLVYPFLTKYFSKGILAGSVKG
ncbi:putative ABC transporter permease protein YtcP [Spirochaetia bacterium]|nr:putative ABC transporter permease protein YtcP [Spirochaetia bacterium]